MSVERDFSYSVFTFLGKNKKTVLHKSFLQFSTTTFYDRSFYRNVLSKMEFSPIFNFVNTNELLIRL